MQSPLSSPDGDPATYPPRPPLDPTPLFSSDESISTLASISSAESSTSSLEHPYSRLVIQDRTASPRRAFDLDRSRSYDDRCVASGSQSLPSSRTSSFTQQERESLVPLRALREGRTESFAAAPPPRHQFLSPLLAVPLPTTTAAPSSSSSSSPSSTHSHSTSTTSNSSDPSSRSAPLPPHLPSSDSPDQSPTTTYFPRTRLFTRSHSFGSAPRPDPRSPSYPTASPFAASPFAYPSSALPTSASTGSSIGGRPASSGTGSTATTTSSTRSSRPWVRDSDASSVASGGSCPSEDAEVYRVAEGDVVEFLDPRPEPPGAKLTVDRDDPTQVVVHVVLPGFSLDNITVAMRRGYKVHIVADSYGENGGHFEKLISLGSDVSSAAPRAEFNGTELHVYVARRQPSKPVRPSSPLPPPSSSTSTTPTGPSTTGLSTKVRTLTGPEGAKAAAKAAREEATLRAKEAAKALPKLGARNAPFAQGPERSGTITQRSQEARARPRLRPGSLTLRAGEEGFVQAAREEEGGRTPRGESEGMRFGIEIGTAL